MAHVRSNDEAVSQLPSYDAKASEDFPGWLIVTCPREDCGLAFLVKRADWLAIKTYKSKDSRVKITGRACPYCFKAARVPARSRIR